MIAPEATALILLAAGRSLRFGEADKLEQPLAGTPLAFHVVAALAGVPFGYRYAVKSGTRLDFAAHGFQEIANASPEAGLSGSVTLGIRRAMADGAEAALVVLADMPRITAAHIVRLLDAIDGPDGVVASSTGRHPCPPAIFGAGRFEALLRIEGDEGARVMIRNARQVIAPEQELIDIDMPADLERLRALS